MTIPLRSGRVRSRKNRAPVPAGHFFQRKRICGIWLFQKPEGRRRLDFQRVFAWNIADFSFRFRPRIGKCLMPAILPYMGAVLLLENDPFLVKIKGDGEYVFSLKKRMSRRKIKGEDPVCDVLIQKAGVFREKTDDTIFPALEPLHQKIHFRQRLFGIVLKDEEGCFAMFPGEIPVAAPCGLLTDLQTDLIPDSVLVGKSTGYLRNGNAELIGDIRLLHFMHPGPSPRIRVHGIFPGFA